MPRIEFESRGNHSTQSGVSSGNATYLLTCVFWSDVTLLTTGRVCASFKVIEFGMLVTDFTLLTMADLIVRGLPCR
jgi:hypothetical protein